MDWIHEYVGRNSGILYGLAAVFIVAEGVVLLAYPTRWWIPLVAVLALAALVLAWHNHRVVVKVVVSAILFIVFAALLMLSATSFESDPVKGTIAPAGMLCGSALFILVSYFIDINASRWTALQIGMIAGFVAAYTMVPSGSAAMAIAAGIGVMIFGVLAMFLSVVWPRRGAGMPERPAIIPEYKVERLSHSLGPDWTVKEYHCRHPFLVAMAKGDGRMFVFVPLSFATRISVHAHRGLVYRNRRIGDYLYRVLSYARRRVDDNAVVLIEDDDGTSESDGVIAIPIRDSALSKEYTKVVDMSAGRSHVHDDIRLIMDMDAFDNRDASGRSVSRFVKMAPSHSERKDERNARRD